MYGLFFVPGVGSSGVVLAVAVAERLTVTGSAPALVRVTTPLNDPAVVGVKVTLTVASDAVREMVVEPRENTLLGLVARLTVMSSVRPSLITSKVFVCGVPTVVENVNDSSATMSGSGVTGVLLLSSTYRLA